MSDLNDLYVALATPYDSDGNISVKDLISLSQFVRGNKIGGFYVGGSTGESLLQSTEERKEVFSVIAEENRSSAKLIAHVGAVDTRETLKMARHCAALGYDGISAIPPIYYPYTKQEITDFYRSVIDASEGTPVLLYNIPAMSGVKFTTEDLDKLLSLKGVAGIKQTSTDTYQTEQIRRRHPEKTILNGFDEILLPALSVGVNGSIGSTFNIMGHRYHQIYQLFRAGKMQEALAIQHACNRIIDVLVEGGVFKSIKYILWKMDIISTSLCREPFGKVVSEIIPELDRIAEELKTEYYALNK
ncbi:N-acetylneuraminate lyase [Pantoea cypripedii]|uniref:N-acetylneuraminate lyase n=1 Tax=Pantoea cypripedii TaxID=55209 RepID=UPI002FCC7280